MPQISLNDVFESGSCGGTRWLKGGLPKRKRSVPADELNSVSLVILINANMFSSNR